MSLAFCEIVYGLMLEPSVLEYCTRRLLGCLSLCSSVAMLV